MEQGQAACKDKKAGHRLQWCFRADALEIIVLGHVHKMQIGEPIKVPKDIESPNAAGVAYAVAVATQKKHEHVQMVPELSERERELEENLLCQLEMNLCDSIWMFRHISWEFLRCGQAAWPPCRPGCEEMDGERPVVIYFRRQIVKSKRQAAQLSLSKS